MNWVRNLRVAGRATLTRGRHTEPISVIEVSPAEAAPVFKGLLASFPSLIKGHFDVTPDASLEAFEREAPRHPMFRVVTATTPRVMFRVVPATTGRSSLDRPQASPRLHG